MLNFWPPRVTIVDIVNIQAHLLCVSQNVFVLHRHHRCLSTTHTCVHTQPFSFLLQITLYPVHCKAQVILCGYSFNFLLSNSWNEAKRKNCYWKPSIIHATCWLKSALSAESFRVLCWKGNQKKLSAQVALNACLDRVIPVNAWSSLTFFNSFTFLELQSYLQTVRNIVPFLPSAVLKCVQSTMRSKLPWFVEHNLHRFLPRVKIQQVSLRKDALQER